MTYCEDPFSFEGVECPRPFDDHKQTACCPDSQGCCFPKAAAEAMPYFTRASDDVYLNNYFIIATLLLFVAAIFFLCCDTSKDSSSCTKEEEDLILVRHSSQPIQFQTVSSGDEHDRTLRILQSHGLMMATAPPLEQEGAEHYYTMLDRGSRPSYSPSSLTTNADIHLDAQPQPPPYRENTFATPDLSILRLPPEESMTSTQSAPKSLL